MGLQQESEQRGAGHGAKGKSKIGKAKQTETTKSKGPDSRKVVDVAKCEETKRIKDDRRTNRAEN